MSMVLLSVNCLPIDEQKSFILLKWKVSPVKENPTNQNPIIVIVPMKCPFKIQR